MPRAPTSSSLSLGTLSQCRPRNVCDREITSDIGRELEFPKTPIAMTKFFCRFFKRIQLDTDQAHPYEMSVCTINMRGIMARSASFSAVSCEASFVKIKQGVKSMTFRLARNFCDSASNMPWRATM